MAKIRVSGLSHTVRVCNFDEPSKPHKHHYGLRAQQEEWECMQQQYKRNIQGLGRESLQILAKIQALATDYPPDKNHVDAWEDVPDPEDSTHTAHVILESW
ncbi:hypothetical protein H2248_000165 [Termitomyces sp. 'cryptogamus']|nr:hypothetical protein H2248_000165 [Termitomyces sp. 'cryptogamus']